MDTPEQPVEPKPEPPQPPPRRRERVVRALRIAVPRGTGLPLLFTALLVGMIIHVQCSQPETREPAPPFPPGTPVVRVLLAGVSGKTAVSVTGTSSFPVQGEGDLRKKSGTVTLTSEESSILVDGEPYGPSVRIGPGGPEGLTLDGRPYRGVLTVALADGGLRIINHVTLPHYLEGVVGHEMPVAWPLEALKSQAVAARTYVAARMLSRRNADFDVFDDTRSQVYGGIQREGRSRLVQAVRETAGRVLTWEGRILTAFFHSTCGGHTAPAEYVFGSSPRPPLSGVPCGACTDSPVYRWTLDVPAPDLADKLSRTGIESIQPVDPIPGGWCRFVSIRHAGGDLSMPAAKLRTAVGTSRFRSTAFTAKKTEEGFRFEGRGWGHGVGLCQWGARGLALQGKKAEQILGHYYPGAVLTDLTDLS